jgi:HAD superfamily hydrolase (TIGR01509 family)
MPDALFFDFDGLMVDTETTDYEAWRFVYEAHGVELPRDLWVTHIGTDGADFSPLSHLAKLTGTELDVESVQRERRAYRATLFEDLCPLPGIVDWLGEARARGVPIGVVSSSPTQWVHEHLERVELREHVDFLKTRDDVPRAKPHPDLYLHALEHLGIRSGRAIAIEDSPNGLAAAKAAGLFCIAVPGPMTRGLCFDDADLVLESLAERSLASVVRLLDDSSSPGGT